MRRLGLPLCALVIALARPVRGDVPATPVDVAALAGTGAASEARIGATGASWDSTIRMQGGAEVRAAWTASSAGSSASLSIVTPQGRLPLARIVAKGGLWYVTEGHHNVRCRPFAFPSALPTLMFFYQASAPRPVDAGQLPAAPPDGVNGSVVTYHTPLSPQLTAQLRGMLSQADQMAAQHLPSPQMKQNLNAVRQMLASGTRVDVDTATGLIVGSETPKFQLRLEHFRWLPGPDAAAVDTAGANWDDRSTGVAGVDPADLAVLSCNGSWTPQNQSAGDMDNRLVDVRTGADWRLPFRGTLSMGAALSPDRAFAVVGGINLGAGTGLLPYLVDLKTGATMPLGGATALAGNTMFPALSPDGRSVAAIRLETHAILKSRLLIMSVDGGEARVVGEPQDMAGPSWLPDGSGVVAVIRDQPADMNQVAKAYVGTIKLDGTVTRLRAGDQPLVLRAQNRILYEDRADGHATWYTCALDGSEAKQLLDGLGAYGFPAASVDGKRLLMMHYLGRGKVPVPTVIDIDGGVTHPVPVGAGLWGTPAW